MSGPIHTDVRGALTYGMDSFDLIVGRNRVGFYGQVYEPSKSSGHGYEHKGCYWAWKGAAFLDYFVMSPRSGPIKLSTFSQWSLWSSTNLDQPGSTAWPPDASDWRLARVDNTLVGYMKKSGGLRWWAEGSAQGKILVQPTLTLAFARPAGRPKLSKTFKSGYQPAQPAEGR